MTQPTPDYIRYIREHVTKNGWRSAGRGGYFRHTETGQYWDAWAVAHDEYGTLRPVWKLLAAQGRGPEVTP